MLHVCRDYSRLFRCFSCRDVYKIYRICDSPFNDLLGNIVEERNVAIVQRSFLFTEHAKQYPTDGLLIDHIIVADICVSNWSKSMVFVNNIVLII